MAADDSVDQAPQGKNPVPKEGHLPVNELLGEFQGANSPFGDDVTFPLPVEQLPYVHPDPDAVNR